ncbi:helix-turn-helix domain-containing protein [Nocardia sp. CNY236]|uniref:helix-turn-helix domain-containing protein n=1 Tax=Nocardia sp. CNY236 TaxID=1169152 RepID=UPI000428E2BF|nr:helix-turn-helix domain-containing protein [Nocardia sp. CNY236]
MNQHVLRSDLDTTLAPFSASALRAIGAISVRFFAARAESDVLRIAAESVPSIGCCHTLACYRWVDGAGLPCPRIPSPPADLETHLRVHHGEGRLRLPDWHWGWSLPVNNGSETVGTLIVAAEHEPTQEEIFLLTMLTQLAGAALANAVPRERTATTDVELRSGAPGVPIASDGLGFYRLVDAAQANGQAQQFVRSWLGVLLDYDRDRRANLVCTLSRYLECGGNYDDSAAALHIHRSTLRYRLGRIRELTGFDLRDVDTRFNLQAATRAWQFLALVDQPT